MSGGAHAAAISEEFIANYDKYNCSLIVVPEEVQSYLCANVLNYYGFPITLEEDNIIR